MRNISIRPLLASMAGATLLLAVPAIAQDTTPPADTAAPSTTSDTMQQQPMPGANDTMGTTSTDNGAANSANAQAMPAPVAPGDTSMPGNMTPPPADAMNKSYPVCTSKMQDSCQNPGEGGARGRSRASDYKHGPAAHHRRHGR